ncbi:hypothetical protein [Bacillus sp. SD088]|nr:hypothetical protein [Bacillus sp. SD088]MBO0994444.1 hypothetical protein [Bacillus sp. SD088]
MPENNQIKVAVIGSGKSAPVHAEAGYRALKIAYAAIKSFHSGMRIEISE